MKSGCGRAADNSASAGPLRRAGLGRHALLLAAGVFFAAAGFNFVGRGESGDWTNCFLVAARAMQAGQPIHGPRSFAYTYPPIMALLAAPLAGLAPTASLAAWYALNVVAMAAVFVCSWRLAGGGRLSDIPRPWRLTLGLASLLACRHWTAPLEKQQFDMVIAAALLAGCLGLLRGRAVWAGWWLGAAAAMKCTPLLFAPYLLWRGQRQAAALLVLTAVGLNLLPDLIYPQRSGGSYLADWLHNDLASLAHAAPGFWHTDLLLNQSLAGFFNRLVQLALGGTVVTVDQQGLPPWAVPLVRGLTYGAAAALLLLSAWRFGRPLRPAETVAAGQMHPVALARLRTSIECGAVTCLMLLLSPMSGKAHYVILVLPCLLLSRDLVERPSPRGWLLVGLLMVCGPLTAKGLVGRAWGDLALLVGLPTWFALLTLVAMYGVLRRADRPASPAAGPPPPHRPARLLRQHLLEDHQVVPAVRVPADADDVVPLLNRQV